MISDQMCVCALNMFSHTDMDQGSLAISNGPKIAYTGDNWVGRMINTLND